MYAEKNKIIANSVIFMSLWKYMIKKCNISIILTMYHTQFYFCVKIKEFKETISRQPEQLLK